jgi:hypothetical protein
MGQWSTVGGGTPRLVGRAGVGEGALPERVLMSEVPVDVVGMEKANDDANKPDRWFTHDVEDDVVDEGGQNNER